MIRVTEEDRGSWYLMEGDNYFYFHNLLHYDAQPVGGVVVIKDGDYTNTYYTFFTSYGIKLTGMYSDHSILRKLDALEVELLGLDKYMDLVEGEIDHYLLKNRD